MKTVLQRRKIKLKASPQVVKDYPVDSKEQKKPLYLVMQSIWFSKIEIGKKNEEFRDGTQFYKSRLCNIDKKTGEILSFKNYKTVILQEGYHPNARRMIVEIEKITLKRDFTIHLGQIIERINF